AESGVLGSMIIQPDVIGPVCMLIAKSSVFYKEEHQILFDVLVSLYEKNTPIDALVLTSALRSGNQLEAVGGLEYLHQVISSVPSAANAEYYAGIVREKALLRG